jgi:hypothetical protein
LQKCVHFCNFSHILVIRRDAMQASLANSTRKSEQKEPLVQTTQGMVPWPRAGLCLSCALKNSKPNGGLGLNRRRPTAPGRHVLRCIAVRQNNPIEKKGNSSVPSRHWKRLLAAPSAQNWHNKRPGNMLIM